jgi:MFS family permease
MGDIQQPLSESYPPDYTIQTKLFSDYSLFYRSKQYWGKLNFNTINTIQWILSIITLAGFIWAFAKNIPDMLMRKTILFVSIALFANAFVCAALSDIIDRYQSRIIWIPIMLFLFLILKEKKKFVSMFKQ